MVIFKPVQIRILIFHFHIPFNFTSTNIKVKNMLKTNDTEKKSAKSCNMVFHSFAMFFFFRFFLLNSSISITETPTNMKICIHDTNHHVVPKSMQLQTVLFRSN